MSLAIIQDFIFSKFQNTGFYLSESLLYNSIWLFLIPLTLLEFVLTTKFSNAGLASRILFYFGISLSLSIVHILLLSALFVGVSHLIFNPPHIYTEIMKSALSGQFYLLVLYYFAVPFIREYFSKLREKPKSQLEFGSKITIRNGTKTFILDPKEIQLITIDKPYSLIYANNQTFMDDRSLKEFETKLNPADFLRVHRSTIINKSFVKTLTSRQNGDYDLVMENGMQVRMSRHYKKHWDNLLH